MTELFHSSSEEWDQQMHKKKSWKPRMLFHKSEMSIQRVCFQYGWTIFGMTTTWLLAQKSSNKMLLRFSSERLFLPIRPLQVLLLLPKWAKSLSVEWRRPWLPAPSHCLQIGRELCVAVRPVSRERPSANLKAQGHNPVIHWGKLGQLQSRRECILSQEVGFQIPECAWRGAPTISGQYRSTSHTSSILFANYFSKGCRTLPVFSIKSFRARYRKYDMTWLFSVYRSLYLWHKSQYKKTLKYCVSPAHYWV